MRRLLLPTLSGVLYFLSWIGFGIWPLAFVCFVPLLWSLRDATPRQALWLGAWMGFVTHLGGYTWIMHVLRVFAFAPPPLAFLGYLLVCVAQGFLFGVMSYALVWVGRRTRWPATALLPLALYPGWLLDAVRRRDPEALVFPYIQLAQETATMAGEAEHYFAARKE